MFDFIPVEYYTPIYYHILLVVVVLVYFKTKTENLNSNEAIIFSHKINVALLIFLSFYMGFRQINGRYFGDTANYNIFFEEYQNGGEILLTSDYFFHLFTQFCSKFMTARFYFFICALLYLIPLYYVGKKWFNKYWGYSFLFFVVSFSFWSAGTNGIRSAIATSFVLLGLSRNKMVFKVLWFLLAVGFHKSMLLPIAAFCLTLLVNNPKWYFYGWLMCIPLSLAAAGFWETLFAGLVEDERISYLTSGNINDDEFSSTGFRWDFLLYSFTAVFAAYYFIYKRKFIDQNYNRLVNVYLTANGFWILVIRANFSNRFAYLSWFMLGLIIIYPLLRKILVKDQHKKIGYILLAYFGFTFLMNVILAY